MVVVHNGIIENHEALRRELQAAGFVFTSQTEVQLYQMVQDCQMSTGIEENVDLGSVRIDQLSRNLIIDQFQQVRSLDVVDLQGRSVLRVGALSRSAIGLGALRTGVYLFRLDTESGPVVKRLWVE